MVRRVNEPAEVPGPVDQILAHREQLYKYVPGGFGGFGGFGGLAIAERIKETYGYG